ERVAFEGKTVRTRGFRLVSPPPAPVPIYVGALMPPMLELAGEVADGVILNFMPVDAVPRMLAHVRAGAERAGRDPATLEVVARFQTVVTDDAPGGARRDPPDDGPLLRHLRLQPLHRVVRISRGGTGHRHGMADEGSGAQRRGGDRRDGRPP